MADLQKRLHLALAPKLQEVPLSQFLVKAVPRLRVRRRGVQYRHFVAQKLVARFDSFAESITERPGFRRGCWHVIVKSVGRNALRGEADEAVCDLDVGRPFFCQATDEDVQ